MSGEHKITIEPTSIRGERGQRYRVIYNGSVLIEDTWNPEYDACRVLLTNGITGKLETWRQDRRAPSMRLDIEKSATLTVEEGQQVGPRFRRWAAHPEHAGHEAISRSRVRSQAPEMLAQVEVPASFGPWRCRPDRDSNRHVT
jgi:hypothetical protein